MLAILVVIGGWALGSVRCLHTDHEPAMRTRVRDAALSEHRRELACEPAGCSGDPRRRWTDLRRWSTLVGEKRVDEATRADPGSLSHNPRDRCAGTGARLPD